ncbi:MAG: FHIPEP family type III secretion protein, partial [Haliangium ochraceum]
RAATAPPLLAPIEVRLGAALWMRLCPAGDGDGDAMARRLENALGPRLFDERGIPLPVLRVLPAAGDAAPAAFIIRFDEVPVAEGDLDGADATGSEVTIADHLWTLLRRHAHLFVDIETTQSLLDSLARSHPALVREVVPKVVSPALLADVLRRLAREEISLRHLKDILGALAGRTGPERDAAALTEHVRAALRRAITLRHAHPDGVLRAYTLDPMIEEAVRAALHKTERGTALALEPDLSRDIVQAVGRAIAHASSNGGPAPVILTSADLRRHVRRLVEPRHPHVAVLAFPELAPDATVQPLGAIRA